MVVYVLLDIFVESGIHGYLRGFSPSSLMLLLSKWLFIYPGFPFGPVFVHDVEYGCNRPVFLPGRESPMGRLRIWSAWTNVLCGVLYP